MDTFKTFQNYKKAIEVSKNYSEKDYSKYLSVFKKLFNDEFSKSLNLRINDRGHREQISAQGYISLQVPNKNHITHRIRKSTKYFKNKQIIRTYLDKNI